MLTIKTALAQFTDAELRTWLEEAYREDWEGLDRDDLIEELVALGKGGCAGTDEMEREELEKDVLDRHGEEVLEDPLEQRDAAEALLAWLTEARNE